MRDDQRDAGAAAALIVTQVMPEDVRHFGLKDGVWVCSPSCAIALGMALRKGLIEIAAAKRAAEGSGHKMQFLYHYPTGPEFRNPVEGMLEAFLEMQEDLDSERGSMLTAFYGDLQGLAGASSVICPHSSSSHAPSTPPVPTKQSTTTG